MIGSMLLSISEVASQIGLRPSAIRYYEQIGILPPAQRVSGQRRYDVTALHRLVVIQRARQTGFTLTLRRSRGVTNVCSSEVPHLIIL